MDDETKLRRFQEEIAEAGTQESRLEGEKESILKRLDEEHGLSGSKEGKAFVKRTEEEKQQLKEALEKKLRQIEEGYGFE